MTDPRATITAQSAHPWTQRTVPARLRSVYPADLVWAMSLPAEPGTIGRHTADDVFTLPHLTVSRRHFEIAWRKETRTHVVSDCGSHNGTRVNGERLTAPRALEDQDVIRVGDVCLVYEVESAAPSMAGPVDADLDRAVFGQGSAVDALRRMISSVATGASPVLILGETGTGKEWIARELHRLSGRRGEFVPLNCATLGRELAESSLFGHVKGAFTGAATARQGAFRAAHGGTLFLDEVGDLPLELQPKLLRALQEREASPVGSDQRFELSARVVAATHVDLPQQVAVGGFRRDLYARLCTWELRVPPLRRRRGDILAWLQRLAENHRSASPTLSANAAEQLVLHALPNNLRDLERFVARLALEAPGDDPIEQLPKWFVPGPEPVIGTPSAPADGAAGGSATEPILATRQPVPDEAAFVSAFLAADGNVSALARQFGRDRRQIYRWVKQYGLRRGQ